VFTRPRGSIKETLFCESTEKDARICASVVFLDTGGPLGAATAPLGTAAGCATAGAFLARSSSAHDFGATGLGGDAFGVSSAFAAVSDVVAAASSACVGSWWVAAGDLTDCCVVEAALGAFVDLIGMRGTAGIVGLRVCFLTLGEDWTGGCMADGAVVKGVADCATSTSEGGWEVDGVSTSASEGPATVEACDSSGSSVGVCWPSVPWSTYLASCSSTACSREGRARAWSSTDTGALRLLRPRAAHAGKSESGTDSQGRGG
jgi:hypothetical protein